MKPDAARAARERKQKIFVIVGAVLLLGLLAIQLPRLLGGSSSAPTATPTQATSVSSVVAHAVQPGVVNAALASSGGRPGTEPTKLGSLSSFSPKDPFVQQVVTASSFAGAAGAGTAAKTETAKPATPKEFTTAGSAPAVTVISVNGARQALQPGGTFPASDPVFVLVAELPDAKSAVIGVAGGAYANGAKTTKLKVDKPLTLVNTTTGARYRIVLVAVGSGDTAAHEKPKP